jgi:S-adenosylmethionine synthetase
MIKLFSSESVTEGHPDKVSDQISDAILDAHLKQDPNSRVACETAVTTNYVLVFGEISSKGQVDIDQVVRNTIKNIGYYHDDLGFNYQTVKIDIRINKQSPDIARGVNEKEDHELGAGDQGLMFGFANKETETFLPLPIYLAHQLSKRLSFVRKENIISDLRPDGKTQVTIAYENGMYQYIDAIVLSTQHGHTWVGKQDLLKKEIMTHIVSPILKDYDTARTRYLINPTGQFLQGGPNGDAGLTGRKIIVDTYGGYAPHGGGAFSGKDATKVDRSAAYMARYIAKNVVAANLCDVCELEIAYAIGVSKPVSFFIDCHGTEKVALIKLKKAIQDIFDLRPSHIIEALSLKNPIYLQTAAYGHFGQDNNTFPWERLDKVDKLREILYN